MSINTTKKSFWEDDPITKIDMSNLQQLPKNWAIDDAKRKAERDAKKPPPNKKQSLRMYTRYTKAILPSKKKVEELKREIYFNPFF